MKKIDSNLFPIATALRETMRQGYSRQYFAQDLIAAFVVSLVAMPLAMALAIAVGLSPQHGLYTAIVAGIITPLLGGSRMQVSGPTAAFVVIVAPILTEFGLRGLILAEIMAGIMLLVLAWARLGRFITFVPYPVTTGFTAGIAVVLGTLSLNDLLGLGIQNLQGSFTEKLLLLAQHMPHIQWQEALVGLVSLFIMFSGKRLSKVIPSAIMGIAAGTLISLTLGYFDVQVATIGSRFTYTLDGILQHGIPPFAPVLRLPGGEGLFAWPGYQELRLLSAPAFVIAALAALESLLSATVADGLSRTKHNPNAELAAIGIANITSGLAGGIPATGAIARTTTNIKSGARSPFASAMHAIFILLYVVCLAPLISYLPMSALAALLLLTAYNMSHYRQFYRMLKIAPRQDIIVLLVCFGLTVFIDMVAGVIVGVLLAALLFIQRISMLTEMTVEESETSPKIKLPANVAVYHITGALFFATVERTFDRTAFLRNRIDTIILDMQNVPLIDMTGLVALKNLLSSDGLLGKRVVICAKPDIVFKVMQKMSGQPQLRLYSASTVDEALTLITKTA